MLRILKETNLQLLPSPLGGDVALNNVLHGSWLTFYWLWSFFSPEKFFKIFSDYFFLFGKMIQFWKKNISPQEEFTFPTPPKSSSMMHILTRLSPRQLFISGLTFWHGDTADWPPVGTFRAEHTEAPLLINLHTHTHTRTRTEESCEKETSRCRTGAYL